MSEHMDIYSAPNMDDTDARAYVAALPKADRRKRCACSAGNDCGGPHPGDLDKPCGVRADVILAGRTIPAIPACTECAVDWFTTFPADKRP